ncbi:hypothetical protein F5148DRAFT_526478 [Russula earlei]|uniref:Uncharacterized protein n=1 Tax=Russula earlei TaxID=71964 RepID=A0ACC0TWR4_9AGAM|nr:hypothetical protein F5148DRAFT_526478 [Russula earlei]
MSCSCAITTNCNIPVGWLQCSPLSSFHFVYSRNYAHVREQTKMRGQIPRYTARPPSTMEHDHSTSRDTNLTESEFPNFSAFLQVVFSRGDPGVGGGINNANRLTADQIEAVIEGLPRLTEADLERFGHHDSSCPICLNTFLASLAEEEMAYVMDSPAQPLETCGVYAFGRHMRALVLPQGVECLIPFLDALSLSSPPPPPPLPCVNRPRQSSNLDTRWELHLPAVSRSTRLSTLMRRGDTFSRLCVFN